MQIDGEGMAFWYQGVEPLSWGWCRTFQLNLMFRAPYYNRRRWRWYYLRRGKNCSMSEQPEVRLLRLVPTDPSQCHRLHMISAILSRCFRILQGCRSFEHVHRLLRRKISLGSLELYVECSCLSTTDNCFPFLRLRTKIQCLGSIQRWLAVDLEHLH